MMRIEKFSIGTSGISLDINLESSANQKAAWQLYIELSTRIATKQLKDEEGSEKSSLKSIYKIFEITRNVLKENGGDCIEVARLAILVLNEVIRPFMTKWHLSEKKLDSDNVNKEFRRELSELRENLLNYKKQLATIAGIPDFVD